MSHATVTLLLGSGSGLVACNYAQFIVIIIASSYKF